MVRDVDVVILGAGPAGCATALAVLRSGVQRVAIVDRPAPQAISIGESATPDVAGKLRQLGLADKLSASGHKPHHVNISNWADQRRQDDFLLRAVGSAWHLDRSRFNHDLKQAADERGAHILTPATLKNLSRDKDTWGVQVSHNGEVQQLNCRYIVDASGRGSTISKRLGVIRKRLDNLVALVLKTPEGSALEGRTLVESMADGWWYGVCLPDGCGLVSLMSDADIIRQHGWRKSENFINQWKKSEELKRWLQPPYGLDLTPKPFAAYSGFLTQASGPGWIAVGDALAAFDPLTSSGIANALGDGLAAADVITDWLDNGSLEQADGYALRANKSISRYLKEWQRQYLAERRWTDREFWQRRQSS